MLKTGLVSITFRKLSPREIVELVSKAGMEGIEWGGDIHVPHGDINRAREVYKETTGSGLATAAYGSYYRVGLGDENLDEFKRIIHTAYELKAPVIRVWAGDRDACDADEKWWQTVVGRSRSIADIAKEAGITVSYEFHGKTLANTNESTLRLLKEVGHSNITTYWQPAVNMSFDERLKGLKEVSPWLTNIHVFQWVKDKLSNIERRPLREGIHDWKAYLEQAEKLEGTRYAMLEFVKADSPEQFLQDAEALKGLVRQII